MYGESYQHTRVVLYLLYTQPEISINYEICGTVSYISWPYQIADHNCRITWVHNIMLFSNVTVSEKAQTTPVSTTQTITSSSTTMGPDKPDLTTSDPDQPDLTTSDPDQPDLTTSAPVKAILDLNVTAVNKEITRPEFVAALPGGEAAAVVDAGRQVLKINKTGHTIKELFYCHTCNDIQGLLLLGSDLYTIHASGKVLEIQPHTGQLLNVYNIPDVSFINHYGSLWSDPSKIPNTDILLLADHNKGEVLSYNLASRHKDVHLSRLFGPTSVSYSFYDNFTYYIVCRKYGYKISIYDSSWDLVSSFGGFGYSDGYLYDPHAAIMSSNNTIIVSDSYNDRISVFTTDGVFLYHLLTQSDGIYRPYALSYYKPYLWVVANNGHLYRYMVNE